MITLFCIDLSFLLIAVHFVLSGQAPFWYLLFAFSVVLMQRHSRSKWM